MRRLSLHTQKSTPGHWNGQLFAKYREALSFGNTRWFKYDRDWFVCKQAALRSSCATLREWSHNLHPPSCSG